MKLNQIFCEYYLWISDQSFPKKALLSNYLFALKQAKHLATLI